jgi:hypothetical protein
MGSNERQRLQEPEGQRRESELHPSLTSSFKIAS